MDPLLAQTDGAAPPAAQASLSWGTSWRGNSSKTGALLLPPPPAPNANAANASTIDPASLPARAGQPTGAKPFKGHIFYGPAGTAARTLRGRAGPLLWGGLPAAAATATEPAAPPASFEARASAAAHGRRGDHIAPAAPGTALVAVTSDRHDGVPAFDRCLDPRHAGMTSAASGAAPLAPARRGLHLPPLAAALARQSWAPWKPLPPGSTGPVPHLGLGGVGISGGGRRAATAPPVAAGRSTSTSGGLGWRPSRARPPFGGGGGGGVGRSHLRAIAGAFVGVQDEEEDGGGGGEEGGGGGGEEEGGGRAVCGGGGRPKSAPGTSINSNNNNNNIACGGPRAAGQLRAPVKGGAVGCLRGQGPSPRSLAQPPRRVLRSAGATVGGGRRGQTATTAIVRPPFATTATTRRGQSASSPYGEEDGCGDDDDDDGRQPDPLLPGTRSTIVVSPGALIFAGRGRRHRAGVAAAEQRGGSTGSSNNNGNGTNTSAPPRPLSAGTPPPTLTAQRWLQGCGAHAASQTPAAWGAAAAAAAASGGPFLAHHQSAAAVDDDSIAAAATGLVSRRAAVAVRAAPPGSPASALAHRRVRSELHNAPDGLAAAPVPAPRGRFAGALTASRFRFTPEGVVIAVAAEGGGAAAAGSAKAAPKALSAEPGDAAAPATSVVVVAHEPASRGGGLVLSDGTVSLPAMPFAARRRRGGWEHAGGRASLVATEQGLTLDALPPARGPLSGLTSYDAAFGG